MSGLRCKPGDLALVTFGLTSAGKIVTCIRLEDPIFPNGLRRDHVGCTWLVDVPLRWVGQTIEMVPYCPDQYLMPIRPEPEENDDDTADLLQQRTPASTV